MITTEIVIDKVKGNDPMPADLRLSKIELATQDRRSELRKHRIFQLKCKTYNIESDTFEISNVIVHNYGANGIYFETKNPFQPCEPVCLSLVNQFVDTCDSEFAKGVHAQVVWCNHLNTDLDPRHGVGVKYFEPIESKIGTI